MPTSPAVLVERTEIVRWLTARLAGARLRGSVVFLEGESGVGKTSVVRALADARPADVKLLWGACDALATPRPLGPLHDMAMAGADEVRGVQEGGGPSHAQFTALLRDLSTPTLAVIEDMHWADEASLDLLRFVGRRIDQTHALLVVTFRDDEVGPSHPLRAVLGDLATASTERRTIEPLSLDGVRRLASSQPIDPGRLYEATGGNPFYVTEVLAAPNWTLPPTVRDAVRARVARLPDAARDVLEAVAVEPGRMEARLIGLLGIDASSIGAATDPGVLQEVDGVLAFRHELARMAVAEGIPGIRRAELHRRILEVLVADGGEDVARLAHHAAGSGDPGAELTWSGAAARAASAAGAHREAVAHYTRALRHERLLESTTAAELHEAYADELVIVDRPADAVEARTRAVSLREEAGDPVGAAVTTADLAQATWIAGDGDDAYALIEAATAALETAPGSVRAGPYAARAYLAMLARRCDEAVEWSRRAIDAAGDGDNQVALAMALNARGAARIVGFEDEGGVADLEQSAEIATRLGNPRAITTAWSNIGSGLGEIRRYPVAAEHLERAMAYAVEQDMDFTFHYAGAWLARVRFETGRWDDAAQLLHQTLGESVSPISPIVALCVQGRLRARRGETGAVDPLTRAWELAVATGDLQRLWPVIAGRAEVAWLGGTGGDEVAADLRPILAQARTARLAWAIGELGYWAWRLGDDDVDTSAGATAFAAHVAGDHAAAAAEWARLGCPYEEAWAMADSSDEPSMRSALATLMRLGAEPLAERVRAAMRDRGITHIPTGPRRATGRSPAGLTEREHEVLALLAAGLTDRAIGERLFISPKTASHHVSAILGKLGVTRRTEAAAMAHSTGLLGVKADAQDGQSSR